MKNLTNIGDRLREERTRISPSQQAFADLCEVSRGTVVAWEKGAQSPNAEVLMRLAVAGADVLYIVTGKRGSESAGVLSEAESTLLTRWRSGSPALRGYLQELGQAPASGSNAVTIGGDVGQQVNGDQTVTAPMTFNVGGKPKKG